jgi:opacity protein-like surface antigen
VKRHRLGLTLLALLVAPGLAGPLAAADGHGTDLFGGYSFAHVEDSSRHGGNLAAGFDLGPLSGFVDTSFHRGSQYGVDVSDLTLMAGPGLRFGSRGRTVFFVRALGGVLRSRASIGVYDVDISESSTRLGFMGGGGADFRVSAKLAVRLQADYLIFDSELGGAASCVPGVPSCDDTGGDGWSSGYRVSAGVVYRFGSAR